MFLTYKIRVITPSLPVSQPVSQGCLNLTWEDGYYGSLRTVMSYVIKGWNFNWNWKRCHRLGMTTQTAINNKTDMITVQGRLGEVWRQQHKNLVKFASASHRETQNHAAGLMQYWNPVLTGCSHNTFQYAMKSRTPAEEDFSGSEQKDEIHPTADTWFSSYYFLVSSSRKWANKLLPLQIWCSPF